jgi:TonB family protein
MSSASLESSPLQTERRSHARGRMEGLTYVDLGPDNGAILIDLGEGGLGFHSVAPVSLDQAVLLKFKLPGASGFIESYAEVVWLDESGKCGGLRFAEMSAELREQIGAWVGTVRMAEISTAEVSTAEVSTEAPRGSEAIAPGGVAAENASAKDETAAAPEPIRAPLDLAAERVADEVSAGISENLAHADVGDIASQGAQTGDASPASETGEERGLAAASAPTFPDISELIAPLYSNLAAEKPAGRQSDSAPARPSEAAEAVQNAADPAAGNPIVRPAGNAATKAHPVAGAPSEGVPSRVRSGIMAMAASASESPARATRSKQARLSHAANPVSAQNRDGEEPVGPRHIRQSQALAHKGREWASEERTSKREETLASQALKIGIGAAAGATLVLALAASLASLRTRVLATASAKSAASRLEANAPEFQVEVADFNNRRWILKSVGEAGSPFGDISSRRNAQPAAAPTRKGAVKSGRTNESDDSSDATETPQPRTARPDELALARPLRSAPVGSQVQTLPPSIFDGITPPVGSLADNLPVTGPNAPGPVPTQTQPSARSASLQAAVLLERVSPVYPAAALRGGVTGEVRVRATIGKDGVPTSLKMVSGDARLADAALAAISQWRYRPATLEGEPIETTITVSVAFELH